MSSKIVWETFLRIVSFGFVVKLATFRTPCRGTACSVPNVTGRQPQGANYNACHNDASPSSGIMRRSCHFERFCTREGRRDTSADPEKVSVWSPTPPDGGKTVVTLMKRCLLSSF